MLGLPNPDPVQGRPAHGGRDRHTAVAVSGLDALKARLEQYERAEKTSTLSPSVAASPFADMDKDGIKEWIADATGSRPQGNPSHETLVRMADEINADLKAKKEAEKQAA